MKDIECPYCGHEYDACQDDGHLCEDSKLYEEECPNCEKHFGVYACISYSFSAHKAECMNGGDHHWWVHSWGTYCEECGLQKKEDL